MIDDQMTFETTNLLTNQTRPISLVSTTIERVVDEGYALAIYPKDNGEFTLWPEPMYLFDEPRLAKKVVEYNYVKQLMLENETKRTGNKITNIELSHLDFEWFGYYQTCANDELTINQWTITSETKQQLEDVFRNWQINIEQLK